MIGAALLLGVGCTEPMSRRGVPTRLIAASPTVATAVVATRLSEAPAVRVVDESGSPVAGVTVTFGVTPGAGMVEVREAISDAEGVARSRGWIIGEKAGSHDVVARYAALPMQSIVFTAVGTPGPLVALDAVRGDHQFGLTGTPALFPLVVFARDTFANAIAGVRVSFAVVSGGGRIDGPSTTTNSDGIATSGAWTLGPAIGEQRAVASVQGFAAAFTVSVREPCADCGVGRIAFVRDGDIYTANANGTDQTRLTGGSEPAWSRDGRIAFTRQPDGVYVMNHDGSGIRLVAARAESPTWSPDGQTLAVATPGGGEMFIETITVEGAPVSLGRISFDRGINSSPNWSPDGRRVAFISDWSAFDFAYEVYTVDRDGRQAEQLTDGFFGSTWPNYTMFAQPAWSPDGQQLALVSCPAWQYTNCEISNVAVMNVAGTSGVRTLAPTRGYVKPAWSPDGRWITYDAPCTEPACVQSVRFISPDGLERGVVITNAHSLAWRP
jgi:hypothetical protein